MTIDVDDVPATGLVISLKRHEGIVLHRAGDVIAVIELTHARRERGRLRVRAPTDVTIDRSDVYRRRLAAAAAAIAAQ